MRQKIQSFDLDEVYGNSPLWPPVSSPGENYILDEKDVSSGEWVDKVMVNKQEPICGVENPFGCWEVENSNMPDILYQKYLSDSTKLFPENPCNLFPTTNQFDITAADELDELDAATSDSSDPDLLWQLNHSKLSSFTNAVGSKIPKPNTKPAKSPELRTPAQKTGPSQSRKTNGTDHYPQRSGRQAIPVEIKRKTGNRK